MLAFHLDLFWKFIWNSIWFGSNGAHCNRSSRQWPGKARGKTSQPKWEMSWNLFILFLQQAWHDPCPRQLPASNTWFPKTLMHTWGFPRRFTSSSHALLYPANYMYHSLGGVKWFQQPIFAIWCLRPPTHQHLRHLQHLQHWPIGGRAYNPVVEEQHHATSASQRAGFTDIFASEMWTNNARYLTTFASKPLPCRPVAWGPGRK